MSTSFTLNILKIKRLRKALCSYVIRGANEVFSVNLRLISKCELVGDMGIFIKGDIVIFIKNLLYEKIGFIGSDSAFRDRRGASGLPVLP